jgi:hypothetical protein
VQPTRSLQTIVAAIALSALTSGCGLVDGVTAERNTTAAIQFYGFGTVTVTVSPQRPSSADAPETVVVKAQPPSPAAAVGNLGDPQVQYQQIVAAVWGHFPYSFTTLSVTVAGDQTETYSYANLAEQLGARPPGIGRTSLSSVLYQGWSDVRYGIYAFAALVVLLFVRLIWRHYRQRKAKMPVDEGKYGGWIHQVSHTPSPYLPQGSTPQTAPASPQPWAPPGGDSPVPTPASWSTPAEQARPAASPPPARPLRRPKPPPKPARMPGTGPPQGGSGAPAMPRMPTLPTRPAAPSQVSAPVPPPGGIPVGQPPAGSPVGHPPAGSPVGQTPGDSQVGQPPGGGPVGQTPGGSQVGQPPGGSQVGQPPGGGPAQGSSDTAPPPA